MKQRPILIPLIASLFFLFPLELLLKKHWQAVTLFEWSLLVVVPIFLVYGLWRVKKMGWYALCGFVILCGIRDLSSLGRVQGLASLQLLSHLCVYLVSLAYFITPRVKVLYFDPKLRWWKTKPRYETYSPVIVSASSEGFSRDSAPGVSFQHKEGWGSYHYPIMRNLSEGGCYVEGSLEFNRGDLLEVWIVLPLPLGGSVMKLKGEVRWSSSTEGRKGLGVQFSDVAWPLQRALGRYVQERL